LEWNPAEANLQAGGYKLAANIPYYVTGALIRKFLGETTYPSCMSLMLQKEVAKRIVAADGKESILSMSVKVFGEPKIIAKVPRGAFTPPPSVESAILAIENISDIRFGTENKEEIKKFFHVLKAGFAHKRKYLKNNLETLLEKEKKAEIWQKYSLNEKVRAEDLKLEEWLSIASE